MHWHTTLTIYELRINGAHLFHRVDDLAQKQILANVAGEQVRIDVQQSIVFQSGNQIIYIRVCVCVYVSFNKRLNRIRDFCLRILVPSCVSSII